MKTKFSLQLQSYLQKRQQLTQSKNKTQKESIAKLEEQLFEAEKQGNKRKQDAIRAVLKKLKNDSSK